jgi:UDPglucose 6-dehydrogenase
MSDVMDVVIVGSGVVGTATGRGLESKGHQVTFCDVLPERLTHLRELGLTAVTVEELAEARADAYFLSVPTPTLNGAADLSYVRLGAGAIGNALRHHGAHPLVVVRSTVPPGTTEDMVIPALEAASGLQAGLDLSVCMNPEFLRAATAEDDFLQPRVIVIGALDGPSDDLLRRVYAPWSGVPVLTMSLRSAEATKYVANLFNATKISFFNELERILSSIGADAEVAFEAASLGAEGLWNPRYGTRGGAPFGGACLPKDTAAFLRYVEEVGLGGLVPMLRATLEVNERVARESATDEPQRLPGAIGAGRLP